MPCAECLFRPFPVSRLHLPMPETSETPQAASGALVELRDVVFGYGQRVVLDGVSLTVPRGKVQFRWVKH